MTADVRRWSAREPGTGEHAWVTRTEWAGLAVVDVPALARRFDRLLVVSAHPDDETLAVGALLAEAARHGMAVQVLLVTDGEGSHPGSHVMAPEVLRAVRRQELAEALAALGLDDDRSVAQARDGGELPAAVRALALPDGAVAAGRAALDEALAEVLAADAERTLVVAPYGQDGHTDHDAAGAVAAEVAARLAAPIVHYPLWVWHWDEPGTARLAGAVLVVPSLDALRRKRTALVCYASQTGDFGRAPGQSAVLGAPVLAHFERPVEVLLDAGGVLPVHPAGSAGPAESTGPAGKTDADGATDPIDGGAATGQAPTRRTPASSFDAMFADTDDPWGVETRWYEQRKMALVEAVLPRQQLGRVLDLGCSTGALTARLAGRADEVVAIDASAQALARAGRREVANVEWRHGELPEALSDVTGAFDTVVLSEIGYFLDGVHLLDLLARIDALLAPDGVVVTANWLRPTRDIPLDGREVDRQVRAVWDVRAHYMDDDVSIVVGARPAAAPAGDPCSSPDAREGDRR